MPFCRKALAALSLGWSLAQAVIRDLIVSLVPSRALRIAKRAAAKVCLPATNRSSRQFSMTASWRSLDFFSSSSGPGFRMYTDAERQRSLRSMAWLSSQFSTLMLWFSCGLRLSRHSVPRFQSRAA